MSALLFALVGIVVGVAVERLTHRPASASVASASPTTAPAPTARRARRRVRPGRVVAWTAVVLVVALLAGLVGAYLWASRTFDRIDTVDVTAQLSPHRGGGTNYLLVGSDNGAGGEGREGVQGSRSDTIMVLRIEGGRARMLSLNRDLWVRNPATGENGRLNATYNAGPANLVQAVTENFEIPIHRYVEIDFLSFSGLVDSLGGVEIFFEHPAIDRGSGLVVEQAGLVRLDGDQSLAYVRSRYYTEIIDGQEVPEGGLPDVNRTARQQAFLRAVMAEASAQRNPIALMRTAGSVTDGLRIDDDMTMWQAARFGLALRGAEPESVVLPVVPRTTSGGAAVLDLDLPAATAVLDQFR